MEKILRIELLSKMMAGTISPEESKYLIMNLADSTELLQAAPKVEEPELDYSQYIARKDATTPMVGDILRSSWGYDQTNVDYYQVVSMTKASVYIRKICKRSVGCDASTEYVMPCPGMWEDAYASSYKAKNAIYSEKGAIKRFRAKDQGGYGVAIESYRDAYLWDGEKNYQTAAGYGH